jgi:cbb3-type cytochrome oxidase maturation protein
MSVLFVAVPVAVLLACSGVIALLWAARRGQLDDLETPALRMLLDDETQPRTVSDACAAPPACRGAVERRRSDPRG